MLAYPNGQFTCLIFVFTFLKACHGTGTILPPFRQLAHNLQSGPIEIINATSIQITKLYYDGKGPDAHFWVGKGVPSPNGTLVSDEYGSIESLSVYTGKNVTINLPANLTVADIDYLAVWCIEYKHNFGHVFMNERYFRTNHSTLFLPLRLKPFSSRNVTSDSVTVEVVNDVITISISNIHYNGTGKNVHFRVGSGKPSSNSKILPNEYGSVQTLSPYNGQNITLRLPVNVNLDEINYLAIWDDDNKTSLGSVYFDQKLRQDQDINITGVQLDAFRNTTFHLSSGPILLINERTFYISNLHHTSNMTQFRISFKNNTTHHIPDETGSYSYLRAYDGDCFYLKLPSNITVTDINKFGIWNATVGYLSYVVLNSTIKIPAYRPYPDVTNDGKRIVRIPKCCPRGQVVADGGCAEEDVHFDVEMKLHLANDTHLNDEPMIREWIIFAPYVNNIDCPKYYLVPEMDNYSLLTTGKLLYISAKEQLSLDKYCMDGIYHTEDGTQKGKYINTPFVCAETDSGPQTMHIAFAICAFLSAISLFLVTAIYFLIRKQNDKRGFSIAGYALSMGIAFICLAVTQIAGLETVCNVLGGLFHFFIVMSFVWFVVITYEAFYHVKYFDQDSVLEDYTKRRRVYIGLSVAMPLVFVVLAYILNLPSGLLNTHLDAICLFDNEKWMLYVPIIISIVLAIGLTGYSRYQIRLNSQIPKDDTTRRFIWNKVRTDCQGRVRFCIFLVALTALCWLSEIITFSLRFSYIVLDFVHALQGVMVLMTIVSTGDIYKRIVRLLSCTDTPIKNGVNGRNEVELRMLNSN